MTKKLKILAPVLALAGGLLLAALIVRAKPPVERVAAEVAAPLVRVVSVESVDLPLAVTAQGTVAPATRTVLAAQVPARVTWVSPRLAEGSFFRRGEHLMRLDSADFELAVTQAEARLARAQLGLDREEAESRMAREEWTELGRGEPDALVLRAPQLAEAQAEIKAAQAALDQARLQLARTTARAPFAGRVERKLADVGQYVAPGTPLAEVFGTDRAEIELKVSQADLRFLDVPIGKPDEDQAIPALLTADLAGASHAWPGRVVRTGSRIDPATRMLTLIAVVDDPYGLRSDDIEPLPMGLFVDAEIEGRVARSVIVLPRSALRAGDRVLVVDGDSRLRFRDVEVLRLDADQAVVSSGLSDGEEVCVSPLTAAVDGMLVRARSESTPPAAPAIAEDLS